MTGELVPAESESTDPFIRRLALLHMLGDHPWPWPQNIEDAPGIDANGAEWRQYQ